MTTPQPAIQNQKSTIQCVILAAGQGTRMKSDQPKVLHAIAGRPMVDYVIDTALSISDLCPIVVIGYGAESVRKAIGDRVEYVFQTEQHGTGHAMLQTRDKIDPSAEIVLVLYGDTPFITPETLRGMIEAHTKAKATLTLLTFKPNDPANYGRIVRAPTGKVKNIIEYKEATSEQRTIREVNSGFVCYHAKWLWEHLPKLQPQPGHGELYLTDLVSMAAGERATIATCEASEAEVLGVNDRVDLARAEQLMRDRINHNLMLNGVTLIDPANTYVEATVAIGADTIVYPGTHLCGKIAIGSHCQIGPATIIHDSQIGNHCTIVASMLESATLEDDVDLGPFSHMRKGAYLSQGVHIGNFAEVKNSRLGHGSKQGHFSYLGDATIGADVNIGAGTITCNFDGVNKFPTEIGDGTFIGSDTMIVAPIKIGQNARTGAGSVVTHDVGDNELVYGVPAKPKKKSVD